MIPTLLSGVGLSASAGLNAYLPLLIFALADLASERISTSGPLDFLSSPIGIIIILLLLPVELLADKVPKLDQASDRIHMFVRPLSAVVVMSAVWSDDEPFPWIIGVVIAAFVAGGVSAVKTRVRPRITTASHGLANPFASMAEDVVSGIGAIVAVFWPWFTFVTLPVLGLALWRLYGKLMSGALRPRGASASKL